MTLRATKVRIYPDAAQAEFLERQFGAVRFVWNKALHVKRHAWRVRGQSLHPVHDLKKLLAVAKASRRYGWLKDFDAMALQQACLNLNRAYGNFFAGRARFPRFKRKAGAQSSYHCTGKMAVGPDWITVPKAPGRIRAKVHRAISGKIRSITLSRSPTGKYHASVLVDDGLAAPVPPKVVDAGRVRGIDMGLVDFLVDDQGRKTPNPKHLRRAQAGLRRKQKALSRKQKGSKNRGKARLALARAHERVANARNDFQHKLSRQLVDETQVRTQVIVAETLSVRSMLKNRRLARLISDAGWSGFLEKLAYKAKAAGVIFVKIDRWEATTKTCSGCAEKRTDLTLGDRSWTCPHCGMAHDRDVNAAINVREIGLKELRASGLRVQACGGLRKTRQVRAAAIEAGSKVA